MNISYFRSVNISYLFKRICHIYLSEYLIFRLLNMPYLAQHARKHKLAVEENIFFCSILVQLHELHGRFSNTLILESN